MKRSTQRVGTALDSWFVSAVVLLSACRAGEATVAPVSPPPVAAAEPTAVETVEPAPPAPVEPVAPAPVAPPDEPAPAPDGASAGPVDVADLGPEHSGRIVRLSARLQWMTTRCTHSMPPSCIGEFRLVDARGVRQVRQVRVDDSRVAIPYVCIPATGLTAESPCPAGTTMDRAARYLITGDLREEPGGLVITPSLIERAPDEPPGA